MSWQELKQAGPVKGAITLFAAGFGLGYSPIASGTVGSLWGVLLILGLCAWGVSLPIYILICVLLTLVAIPVCHVAEQVYQKKDDGRIVADEFLTYPICMIGLVEHIPAHPWLVPVAFLTCRFFDIVKLPPARQLESVPGGAGITLDDAAASLYSLAANWVIFSLVV